MTTLASDNFDSDTTGAIAPGWANLIGTWVVGTSSPISGTKTFGNSPQNDGDACIFTGQAAQGDTVFQLDYKNLGDSQGYGLYARLNGAGTNGYLLNVGAGAGQYVASIYKQNSGLTPMTSANTGTSAINDIVHCEILVTGSTIEGRVWTNGAARPSSPTVSASDSSFATGQVGVRYGQASNLGAQGFDNFVLQDTIGTLAAGTASLTSAGSTIATVTTTAATGGTPSYTNQWYRSTTSGFTPGGGNIVSGATSLTLNDTGLTPSTTYFYKCVQTDSASGTVTTNQVTATTAGASLAAGTITVGTVGSTTASLSITAATGGTSPYTNQWYRSTTSGFTPGGGNILSGATGLTLNDTGLAASTVYFYKVIQTDSASATVTATQATLTTTGSAVTIARTNAALLYSPSNWADDGTSRMSANTGAYVKFNFTGTSLKINTTALGALTLYPIIRAVIDDEQYDVTLTNGGTQYTFVTGLASGTHSAMVLIRGSDGGSGGWWDLSNSLKITGFQLDAGATVSAQTARPKIGFFLGDSLTAGYFADGNVSPTNDDALATHAPILAEAFNLEYAQVGWNASGFTTNGVAGVPPFNTNYASIASGFTRMSGSLFATQPDYIFVLLGQNGSVVQSDVATAIANLRTAAPSAWIFMIVVGGGFGRAAITAAVTAAGDAKVKTIDAGTEYQTGLIQGFVHPSFASFDGTHYNRTTYARLATKWGQQIEDAITASGTGTFPTAAQVLNGITFGPTNNLTGTVTLPSAGNVATGITFGPSLSLTGTFAGGATITSAIRVGPAVVLSNGQTLLAA